MINKINANIYIHKKYWTEHNIYMHNSNIMYIFGKFYNIQKSTSKGMHFENYRLFGFFFYYTF